MVCLSRTVSETFNAE